MSDELEELEAERKLAAINELQALIVKYNDVKYSELPPIEEALLFTTALQMAMSVNEHTGVETFKSSFIRTTAKDAVDMGKKHVERARAAGVLPRPIHILKPGGGTH